MLSESTRLIERTMDVKRAIGVESTNCRKRAMPPGEHHRQGASHAPGEHHLARASQVR
jgi:hypothetical protein